MCACVTPRSVDLLFSDRRKKDRNMRQQQIVGFGASVIVFMRMYEVCVVTIIVISFQREFHFFSLAIEAEHVSILLLSIIIRR